MANYKVLDAYGSVLTVASSTIGGVEYPIVKLPDGIVSSITGTVTTAQSGTVITSVAGTVPVTQSGAWTQSVVGTVSTAQSGTVITSVSGTVTTAQSGTVITSVAGQVTVVSSIAGGIFPISGSVAAVVTNDVNVTGSVVAQIKSSVLAVVSGTVTADQGTGFGSVAAHIKSGSVIAVLGGNTSVVVASGTVTVDQGVGFGSVASHIKSGSVIAVLGGNTSVLTIPAARSSIQGVVSLTSTSVTTMVAAAGAGISNHITDIWLANTGASATLVTFSSQGGASILGYTIVPAGGGSNLPGLTIPIATPVNTTFNIQAATATSTLYATVKGYTA